MTSVNDATPTSPSPQPSSSPRVLLSPASPRVPVFPNSDALSMSSRSLAPSVRSSAPPEASFSGQSSEALALPEASSSGPLAVADELELDPVDPNDTDLISENWCPPFPQWGKRVVFLLIVVAVALVVYFTLYPHLTDILNGLNGLGPINHLILIFCIFLCGIPPMVLYLIFELASGFLFQSNFGIAYITVIGGAVPGAAVGFLVGYIFRSKFQAIIHETKRLRIVVRMIEEDVYKFMFLFRLSFIPFSLLNAICGASNIPFFKYMAASIPSMLIQIALLTWMGSSLANLSAILSAQTGGGSGVGIGVIVSEIVMSLLLAAVVGVLVRRTLMKEEAKEDAAEQREQQVITALALNTRAMRAATSVEDRADVLHHDVELAMHKRTATVPVFSSMFANVAPFSSAAGPNNGLSEARGPTLEMNHSLSQKQVVSFA